MTKHKQLPSLERLNELLTYDPESGELRWRISYTNRVRAGAIAGCINPTRGYRQLRLDGVQYTATRIIWKILTGEDPGSLEIDHINRVRDDNRAKNLRAISHQENQQNRVMPNKYRKNLTGKLYIKYRAYKKTKQWEVAVRGQWVGAFNTHEEAILARDEYLKVGLTCDRKV